LNFDFWVGDLQRSSPDNKETTMSDTDLMKTFTDEMLPRLREVSRDLVTLAGGAGDASNSDPVPLLVLWLCLTRHLVACGYDEDMAEQMMNNFAS
jgi:hypothetical protein